MKTKTIILAIVGILVLITFANGFYTVSETEQVVITQFGRPIGNVIKTAGVHWKIPFIQDAHFFEKRILEWDGDPNQIPTKDKKYIWLDTTARWKISDALRFLQSVGNEVGAQGSLDDIIDAATRDVVSDHLLVEVVRNSNRPAGAADTELMQDSTKVVEKINFGREKITRMILAIADSLAPKFGIDIIDVRIKRINYVEDVRKKVYERMISERRRIAERYRSEGKGQMAEIEGNMEKELKRITSEAYRTAVEIQGKADAQATRIYANAYNRDPEFYSFLKTLQTYKSSLDSTSTIVFSTRADYWKFLRTPRK
ncbi:MAG: protease modulator HflC [Calditrichaeota bacterium]|nr:protease modulator HflC [Calditrichota bacterium]